MNKGNVVEKLEQVRSMLEEEDRELVSTVSGMSESTRKAIKGRMVKLVEARKGSK